MKDLGALRLQLIVLYMAGTFAIIWFVEQNEQSKLVSAKTDLCVFVRTLSGTIDVSTYLLDAEECRGLNGLLTTLLPIEQLSFRDENTTVKDFILDQSGRFTGFVWGNISYTGRLKSSSMLQLGLVGTAGQRSGETSISECCTVLNDCKGVITVFA